MIKQRVRSLVYAITATIRRLRSSVRVRDGRWRVHDEGGRLLRFLHLVATVGSARHRTQPASQVSGSGVSWRQRVGAGDRSPARPGRDRRGNFFALAQGLRSRARGFVERAFLGETLAGCSSSTVDSTRGRSTKSGPTPSYARARKIVPVQATAASMRRASTHSRRPPPSDPPRSVGGHRRGSRPDEDARPPRWPSAAPKDRHR